MIFRELIMPDVLYSQCIGFDVSEKKDKRAVVIIYLK